MAHGVQGRFTYSFGIKHRVVPQSNERLLRFFTDE